MPKDPAAGGVESYEMIRRVPGEEKPSGSSKQPAYTAGRFGAIGMGPANLAAAGINGLENKLRGNQRGRACESLRAVGSVGQIPHLVAFVGIHIKKPGV